MSGYVWVHSDNLREVENGTFTIYKDAWWIVDDYGNLAFSVIGDASAAQSRLRDSSPLVWGYLLRSPQCNRDRRVTERIFGFWDDPEAQYGRRVSVAQVPLVLVPYAGGA